MQSERGAINLPLKSTISTRLYIYSCLQGALVSRCSGISDRKRIHDVTEHSSFAPRVRAGARDSGDEVARSCIDPEWADNHRS